MRGASLSQPAFFCRRAASRTATGDSMLASNVFRQTMLAAAVAATLPVFNSVVHAQSAPAGADKKPEPQRVEVQTLKPVVVTEKAEAPQGKDSVRVTTSTSAKGNQAVRDIPQSITTVTEKLINERNLDTVKDVLHNTAGVTFLAAEGGEEDIRLRGFSLATTGDIYLDGMRDAAFYDRDTFNYDRLDLLRGSASMLFGRGSTGGVANQVSKAPHNVEERSITATVGSYNYNRLVADINQPLAPDVALRVTAMKTHATNNGAGSRIDKEGAAASLYYGIGHRHEFRASYYWLNNNNGINYGLPWIRPTTTATGDQNTIITGLKPAAYYGLASDYNAGQARIATVGHLFRFGNNGELKTQLRVGDYERDLRASAIRFSGGGALPANTLGGFSGDTVFTRGTNLKIQDLSTVQVQSDFLNSFTAFGKRHQVLAGVDYAEDDRTVYAARGATQGGVTLSKPTIRAGAPADGATVDEALRVLRVSNDFNAKSWGAYVQDNIDIVPTFKLVLGLRRDSLEGNYNQYAIPNNAAGPVTTTRYTQSVSEWSKRVGVLYQPSDLLSFHASYGTSFNTSGDTYSYNALSANTPPESSENFEIGARIESASKQLSTRIAIFRSVKNNERNTDPDTAATRLLLSGKRHAQGMELDMAGRINKDWEVYLSYVWIPTAKVDVAASTATTVGNRVGDRPGLTPKHSGTVWTTYQLNAKARFGGGINMRSSQAPADVTAPPWEAPRYVTGDLFAEYKYSSAMTFKANVSNVGNKLYADSLYRGHYVPGAGRLVQGTVTYAF
jgi:catecholate siderophore receptor